MVAAGYGDMRPRVALQCSSIAVIHTKHKPNIDQCTTRLYSTLQMLQPNEIQKYNYTVCSIQYNATLTACALCLYSCQVCERMFLD